MATYRVHQQVPRVVAMRTGFSSREVGHTRKTTRRTSSRRTTRGYARWWAGIDISRAFIAGSCTSSCHSAGSACGSLASSSATAPSAAPTRDSDASHPVRIEITRSPYCVLRPRGRLIRSFSGRDPIQQSNRLLVLIPWLSTTRSTAARVPFVLPSGTAHTSPGSIATSPRFPNPTLPLNSCLELGYILCVPRPPPRVTFCMARFEARSAPGNSVNIKTQGVRFANFACSWSTTEFHEGGSCYASPRGAE